MYGDSVIGGSVDSDGFVDGGTGGCGKVVRICLLMMLVMVVVEK